MNLNNLTFSHFEKLTNAGFSLDHVFLLLQISNEIDVQLLCEATPKLKVLHQTLIRKGLVSETGVISLTGRELLKFADEQPTEEEKKPVRRKAIPIEGFEAWWKAYPGTDTFRHKGKTFSGSRNLRQKKDECKVKFENIVEEGEYTADELIKALQYEVEQKKNTSVEQKANKLTFMQNSLTYLNQRTFEPYIELIREGTPIKEPTGGGTDI